MTEEEERLETISEYEDDIADAENEQQRAELQSKLDEFIKNTGEKSDGSWPIKQKPHYDDREKHPDRDDDDDHDDRTKIIKKYYREDDDDDDDNDVPDLAVYNMGYRDGRFDRLSNMPFSDISPFDDRDAETWYKIGYSAGWNSIVGESRLTIK